MKILLHNRFYNRKAANNQIKVKFCERSQLGKMNDWQAVKDLIRCRRKFEASFKFKLPLDI